MSPRHLARWAWFGAAVMLAGGLAAHGGERKPDVHFVPTPHEVVNEMLKTANVGPGDVVYDLGCGDGRIVITAVGKFGAKKGIGIDIDPERIQESTEEARKAKVTDRVTFLEQDIFETDFSEATVISLYLLPVLNVRLRPALLRQLRPGDRIVSHAFDMGEWQADKTMEVPCDDGEERTAYYWVVPGGAAGTWRWTLPGAGGAKPYELCLRQCFQAVRGTVKVDGREQPIADATLTGDRLSFSVAREGGGKLTFRGRLVGDTLVGRAENSGGPEAGPRDWTAKRDRVNAVGTWTWTQGEEAVALRIERRDGRHYASLTVGDKRQGRFPHFYVWGNGVYFLAGDPQQTYEGVIEGDRIVGTVVKGGNKPQEWTAQRKP